MTDLSKDAFTVVAFVGDFPLEGQPDWTKEFAELEDAKNSARATFEIFRSDPRATIENFQVVVMSDYGETVNFLIDLAGKEYDDIDKATAISEANMMAEPQMLE